MKVDIPMTPTLEAMAAGSSKIDAKKIAREFESLLFAEVWKDAVAPKRVSKLLDGGSAERMYREMFVDEVVRRLPTSHALGLAERITAEIERRSDAHESRSQAQPDRERDDV